MHSSTSSLTADVSSLTLGTSYRFKVSAVNQNGEGPQSSYAEVLFATSPGIMAAPTITMGTGRRRSLSDI